ncbi:uncharacterized protein LOC111087892 [Limulus polyphemus]|uniref:Uncharacterized protein LOC111087892 n=1 Tax=Limulus polyphemus TaxID=6850 RepID=A0ABM1T7N9_LIMPO|nr:uncharacterized protein LOC111087892 [Limulus polyphemus]
MKAKCKYCEWTISTSGKTTHNLPTHVKHNQGTELRKSTPGSGISVQMQQPAITATHPRQKHITNKHVNFIASTLQSSSVVKLKDFQDLMATMDFRYVLPSRKHLSTMLIKSRFDEVQQKVIFLLQCHPTSMSLDIWSSRQMHSFLGVTGHFILDWKMETVIWLT